MRTECFFEFFRFRKSNGDRQCVHGSQVLLNETRLISNHYWNGFQFTSRILNAVFLWKPWNLSPFSNPNGLIFRSTSNAFWSARLASVFIANESLIIIICSYIVHVYYISTHQHQVTNVSRHTRWSNWFVRIQVLWLHLAIVSLPG